MPSRALEAGKAFIKFAIDDAGLQKELRTIERRLSSTGKSIQRVGQIGAAAGAAIVGPLSAAVKTFTSVGDELNKMSARTGASAQFLSEMKFAAKQTGAEFTQLEGGIKTMQRTLLNAERGLTTATDTLDDLELKLDDLRGKSPEEQFQIFADRLARIEDPGRRAALAMQVFGRAGQRLIPLLSLGRAGMQELRDEANALGVTLSDEDAAAAAELTDALSRAWEQFTAFTVAIGAALAGPLTELLSYTEAYLRATIDWVKENQGLVVGLAAVGIALTVVGTATIALGAAFSLASAAVGAFTAIVGILVPLLSAPVVVIGLIVGALAALVDWLFFGGKGAKAFGDIVTSVFGAIATFVGKKISEVLGYLGSFVSELLGLDSQIGSSSSPASAPTPPSIASPASQDVSRVAAEQKAEADRRAAELQDSLRDVADSVSNQSELAKEANDVAIEAAREEIPLLTRIAFATEQSREFLRRIESGNRQGVTFA